MGKTITIKKNTQLEILEPTQVPRPILEICCRNHICPDFYGKMGEMYCLHYEYDEDECGFAFFVLVDGTVYVPEPEQLELLNLANQIVDFVHGEKE